MNLQMMDLAKLKVVELRAELTQRGLDAKGNKPVLVERLRKALEEESGDPKAAAEASVQDTNEENVGKAAAQKEARDRTPEPLPPKTPGRSSRSSAASTPSKATPMRGNPKILLTPLTEKQITPTKSPPVEKTEKTPEKQEKTSPEKQETISPEKPEITSPEKPEKPVITSPEKQEKASPEKQEEASPEKQEKVSPEQEEKTSPLKNEAPPDEPIEEEKPQDATQTQDEAAPEHLEAAPEAAKTDIDAAPADVDENSEEAVANAIPDETEPKSEEPVEETEKPALDDEKLVDEDDKEEESSAAAPEVSEDNSAEAKDTAQEKIDEQTELEALEGAGTAEEEADAPEIDDEDKLLEDEEMETNENIEDNEEPAEPMEVKPEAAEDAENAAKAAENTEVSAAEETQEEKPKVEVKEEMDDKSNVDNALLPKEEQQDVEMKEEMKEEPQDDSEQDSKDRDRKDRKDRKRKRSASPQEERHKSPPMNYKDDEPDLNESDVVLSWYDSDLNLVINRESFLSATAMHSEGFGYIWAGARATFGFTEGKVYYETKITECCEVDLPDEAAPHVLRAGWSVQGTTMQLGEEPLTYGFGGTAKISTGNRFSDYGVPFGKDDVVGCYLDLSADGNVVISYTINGKDLGPAFTVSKSVLEGKALYPHVLTKNCTVECNFGQEKSWCDDILEGYVPAGTVDLKERVPGPRRPEKREDCEIIMMCGLPAAGKTVWATKYAADHPEKMYNILGTNALIEKMKVIGLPRKRNYHGRWEVLINKCTRCLNKLLDLASSRRRNYILDQTNVYPSAQRRKMRSFYGYVRRAVVIVPTDEEFKSRTAKRTACEGEVAPESAVLEMKANFGIPVVGESFDHVEWVELPEEEAKKMVEKYNKEGKEAGFGLQQASKRPRFDRSDNHRESRDSRQSSRDSRDSRDHRDRRNNYPDRSRNSTWRGGSSGSGSGGGGNGWRDRQQRPAGGHVRHGGGGSGGYGGPSGGGGGGGGGWRGRGAAGGPPSSYRPLNDRRVAVHDRRTSGSDRNRSAPTRQGGWGPMNSYQSSQQSSGWGGSQSGNWPSSQSQQQGSWGGQQAWGQPQHQQQQQQQQQQWGNWKGYGQSTYAQQSGYSQQGYGNGNWGSWNQQYYNQYWGQQQPTGQTSAAGSQAVSVTGSTTTGNSTANTGSTYGNYSPAWQGYAQSQSYSFPAESSNTNAQQQK